MVIGVESETSAWAARTYVAGKLLDSDPDFTSAPSHVSQVLLGFAYRIFTGLGISLGAAFSQLDDTAAPFDVELRRALQIEQYECLPRFGWMLGD